MIFHWQEADSWLKPKRMATGIILAALFLLAGVFAFTYLQKG
jgi:hypothetical protein